MVVDITDELLFEFGFCHKRPFFQCLSYDVLVLLFFSQGRKVYETTGGVDLIPSGSPLLDSLKNTYNTNGLDFEHLTDAAEIEKRFPQFRINPARGYDVL